MRQLVCTTFITNNHTSLHLWWKENLVKYQKVLKHYVHHCNKEFNIFLCRNPPHPSTQAVPLKKIDKHTKEILKKVKDLKKLFHHKENAESCNYFQINEYKKVKIKEQDFSLSHLNN